MRTELTTSYNYIDIHSYGHFLIFVYIRIGVFACRGICVCKCVYIYIYIYLCFCTCMFASVYVKRYGSYCIFTFHKVFWQVTGSLSPLDNLDLSNGVPRGIFCWRIQSLLLVKCDAFLTEAVLMSLDSRLRMGGLSAPKLWDLCRWRLRATCDKSH